MFSLKARFFSWKLFPTYFSHFLPAESSPTWPRHSSAWTLDIKAGLSVVFTSWDSWCPACIWSGWTRCRTDSRPAALLSPPRPPPPLQAGDCRAPAWCLPLQCDISLCTDTPALLTQSSSALAGLARPDLRVVKVGVVTQRQHVLQGDSLNTEYSTSLTLLLTRRTTWRLLQTLQTFKHF